MSDKDLVEKASDAIRWASESGGWRDMARSALTVFREHDREVAAKAWDEGYWLGINGHTGPGNPYAERNERGSDD